MRSLTQSQQNILDAIWWGRLSYTAATHCIDGVACTPDAITKRTERFGERLGLHSSIDTLLWYICEHVDSRARKVIVQAAQNRIAAVSKLTLGRSAPLPAMIYLRALAARRYHPQTCRTVARDLGITERTLNRHLIRIAARMEIVYEDYRWLAFLYLLAQKEV